MEQKKQKSNIGIFIAIAVIIIIIILGLVLIKPAKQQPVKEEKKDILPQVEIVPTVDKSVVIKLTPNKSKTEVTLYITNFPKGTTSVEYSLSYEVEDGTIQGTETTEPVDLGEETIYEKTILLGTESSGNRVYHKVAGDFQLDVKFNGDYGKKIYQGKFPLN